MNEILHDLKFGLRSLLRSPGFSIVALLAFPIPARRPMRVNPIEALRYE